MEFHVSDENNYEFSTVHLGYECGWFLNENIELILGVTHIPHFTEFTRKF
jgi:hypothetical protein